MMLAPRWMTAAGTGLAVLGVLSYAFIPSNRWEALAIGVGLGAAVVIAAHASGRPQPVPEGGYDFPGAMAVLYRASIGGIVVASAVTGFGFMLWIRGQTGGATVLMLFALSLLVVYASVIAAAGLVHVAHVTRGTSEPEATSASSDDGEPEPES